MTHAQVNFHELETITPVPEEITQRYAEIEAAFDGATDQAGRGAAIASWDGLRRELGTWSSLVGLKFRQDTADADRKAALDAHDEVMPRFSELEVAFMRKVRGSEHAEELTATYGPHLLDVWDCSTASYDPAIEDETVARVQGKRGLHGAGVLGPLRDPGLRRSTSRSSASSPRPRTATSATKQPRSAGTGSVRTPDELDDLTESIADMADSLREMKGQIKVTLDEHNQIVNNSDGDYRGHYEKFTEGIDDIESRRDDAKQDLDDVKAAATPFFAKWEQDLQKYNSEEMRARGKQRLDETRARYEEVRKHGQAAREAYGAMMDMLKDHRLAWERDLNQTSAESMKQYRPELEKNWGIARDAINAVIQWAEKYKASVETRKQPTDDGAKK